MLSVTLIKIHAENITNKIGRYCMKFAADECEPFDPCPSPRQKITLFSNVIFLWYITDKMQYQYYRDQIFRCGTLCRRESMHAQH